MAAFAGAVLHLQHSRAAPQRVAADRPGADLEIGFCDGSGKGFHKVQPPEHMERWDLPYDNGTHLVVNWRSHRSVSGRNVRLPRSQSGNLCVVPASRRVLSGLTSPD